MFKKFPSILDGGPAPRRWWSDDIAKVVASRPRSLWAVVDWRHLLGPASIVDVSVADLHVSRALDGTPITVPWRPDAASPAPIPKAPLTKVRDS